jgi:hypothetical protein
MKDTTELNSSERLRADQRSGAGGSCWASTYASQQSQSQALLQTEPAVAVWPVSERIGVCESATHEVWELRRLDLATVSLLSLTVPRSDHAIAIHLRLRLRSSQESHFSSLVSCVLAALASASSFRSYRHQSQRNESPLQWMDLVSTPGKIILMR